MLETCWKTKEEECKMSIHKCRSVSVPVLVKEKTNKEELKIAQSL